MGRHWFEKGGCLVCRITAMIANAAPLSTSLLSLILIGQHLRRRSSLYVLERTSRRYVSFRSASTFA